ncbi:hypothetical protein PS918_00621 [Pseudomonas fluorescens]|uniref:Uncharacterized protein n=1 Tax=Pseudomonas fluorescens TaxID=294 RepID=A0A5E7R1X3_PSEFL|nr:hypothetical protein [Pseudomonas fluorescens]VVP67735.1 hypothetical protein PS918_00621 [Pseudomonas fluorescens]
MKPIPALAVVALASILAAIGFTARAAEVPLGSHSMEGHLVTRVLAVDPANHQVTIEDANKNPVSLQLTEKARTLNTLKVGEKVDIHVVRSVAYVLDTNVDAAPGISNESVTVRATQDNPDPGGEAVRKVKVTSRITRIDLKKHEVTLLPPEGELTVLKVEDPQLQARMKKLQVGQTINAIYTEVMKIDISR